MSAGLPSGWETYYGVVFAALLSLGLPLGLSLLARLLSSKAGPGREGSERGLNAGLFDRGLRAVTPAIGQKLNTRFFLAALLAFALLASALLLIPCSTTLSHQVASQDQSPLKALIAIVSIAGACSLALLYASRKGDLGWLRTYQSSEAHPTALARKKGEGA